MEVLARTSPGDPTDDLDVAVCAMAAASAGALRAVVEINERKRWRRDGATSMTEWLTARYGLAWGTAREWVRVAYALRRLPHIARAYGEGRLSWDQLRPLTRVATPEADARWAERGPELRPLSLWREAARRERVTASQAAEVHAHRSTAVWWDPHRTTLYLEGQFGAEQGAALEAALSRRSEQVVLGDDPANPAQARMADALVELVTGGGGGHPTPATVVVHAQAEAVAGIDRFRGPWLAETEGGSRLPDEAVRRLACDGRIEWVLEDGGRPVGIGRRGRVVPGQVARVLRHRDGARCRFPGCGRKRWLHAHHIVHWADGGPTNLDNLVLLCPAHHRLIHEGGWRISGHPGRDLRFHDPHGRPLRMVAHEMAARVRAGPAGYRTQA